VDGGRVAQPLARAAQMARQRGIDARLPRSNCSSWKHPGVAEIICSASQRSIATAMRSG